jgi:hypothetical protein
MDAYWKAGDSERYASVMGIARVKSRNYLEAAGAQAAAATPSREKQIAN